MPGAYRVFGVDNATVTLPVPGWEWLLAYEPVPGPAGSGAVLTTFDNATGVLVGYNKTFYGAKLRTHGAGRRGGGGSNASATGAGEVGVLAAVFHFSAVFLGPAVRVRARGALPLVVMSRSALVLDTRIDVVPGTLGGFPGGRGLLMTHTNTLGPGAPAVRTYRWTLAVAAAPVRAAQRVRLWCAPGHSLRGAFRLCASGDCTERIPATAEPDTVAAAIGASLRGVGTVEVRRSENVSVTEAGGDAVAWDLDFLTAVGAVPLLTVDAAPLAALRAGGDVISTREGNEVGGNFTLWWGGVRSPPLPANVTPGAMAIALAAAWACSTCASPRATPPAASRCARCGWTGRAAAAGRLPARCWARARCKQASQTATTRSQTRCLARSWRRAARRPWTTTTRRRASLRPACLVRGQGCAALFLRAPPRAAPLRAAPFFPRSR
jgi:hypothetical protein